MSEPAVVVDLGSGLAHVGAVTLAVTTARQGPPGALIVGGLTLRPLRFGERIRLVEAAESAHPGDPTALARAVLAAATVGGTPDGDRSDLEAVALHLAGARRGSGPSFADAVRAARTFGWALADILEADADLVDWLTGPRSTGGAASGAGWTSIVIAPADRDDATPPSPDVRDALAANLLRRSGRELAEPVPAELALPASAVPTDGARGGAGGQVGEGLPDGGGRSDGVPGAARARGRGDADDGGTAEGAAAAGVPAGSVPDEQVQGLRGPVHRDRSGSGGWGRGRTGGHDGHDGPADRSANLDDGGADPAGGGAGLGGGGADPAGGGAAQAGGGAGAADRAIAGEPDRDLAGPAGRAIAGSPGADRDAPPASPFTPNVPPGASHAYPAATGHRAATRPPAGPAPGGGHGTPATSPGHRAGTPGPAWAGTPPEPRLSWTGTWTGGTGAGGTVPHPVLRLLGSAPATTDAARWAAVQGPVAPGGTARATFAPAAGRGLLRPPPAADEDTGRLADALAAALEDEADLRGLRR